MTDAPFIHLRLHTAYSLSEGAIRIADLPGLCRDAGMPAVAVTDTANLFGALEFSLAAAAAGVQPIVGCLLPFAQHDAAPPRHGPSNGHNGSHNGGKVAPPDRLLVLVQTEAGYKNLMDLSSRAFLDADPSEAPLLALPDLDTRSNGLIALTGTRDSTVGRFIANGRIDLARAELTRLRALFAGRLYVELQRHGLPEERQAEPALVDLAYELDLPLVATNDVYFADESMYEAHDALLCIADGAYVSQSDRRRVTREHRFKSSAEMAELFADLPEAVANSSVIAQRCSYMPAVREPILPPFPTDGGRSEGEQLVADARAGLAARLARAGLARDGAEAQAYWERLEFELEVIEGMQYAGYFLIVADFIQWAKAHDIPVGPGRGSGAGSVVAWALTITDLDPLRWGLLFERFLNPARVSMPDFDIDFCQERRDEVIEYVQGKYGPDHVAQIITFGKLQARAVIRDVGRVLEMPYGQVDRISKLVPHNPANPMNLAEAIAAEAQLRHMRDEDENVADLLRIALKLEGLYRNASTHAAGVVIGDRRLSELVPLYRDPRSQVPSTQFNMKDVEKAGLVKFDFLGLKTLSVLQRAVDLLRRRGIDIELDRIPLDDLDTFRMMSRGDTTGVFQFESTGMRSLLREAGVDAFSDMIALVALYRPGPMENIPKFVACKHGREQPEFLHDSIVPITADTYGVIIYQEQVMQIAQAFAGFDLGQADLLRRAMGKKIKAEMEAQRDDFVHGAMARGVDEAQARYVFDLVDKFAGYGFNKAHSAGYALVAYETAYLKAHYPVEFFAATMTFDLNNTDKLSLLRQELNRIKIPMLPPDVNRSEATFSVEPVAGSDSGDGADNGTEDGTDDSAGAPRHAVRYALAAIKGVGRQAMESLVEMRQAGGPFEGLADFAARIDPQMISRRQLEQLVAAGALDSLHANRAQAFAAIDAILAHAQSEAKDRASGQASLFGDEAGAAPAIAVPDVDEWSSAAKLTKEYDALGFYLSAHPIDDYAIELERLGAVKIGDLEQVARANGGSAMVKQAGTVLGLQVRISQRGSRYAFVQLSDPTGVVEGTIFAEVLGAAQSLLESGRPVLVHGTVRLEDDLVRLTVLKVEPLDDAVAAIGANMKIWVRDTSPLASLRDFIDREASPRRQQGAHGPAPPARNGTAKGTISLVVSAAAQEIEVALDGNYLCTPQIRAAVKAIPGVVDAKIL